MIDPSNYTSAVFGRESYTTEGVPHYAVEKLFPGYTAPACAPAILVHAAQVMEEVVQHGIIDTAENSRCYQLRLDIILSHTASRRAVEAIASILHGAGLQQYSGCSWGSAPCGIEEITDSLSDVFLELQASDNVAMQCVEALHVSMCPVNLHGKASTTIMFVPAASDHETGHLAMSYIEKQFFKKDEDQACDRWSPVAMVIAAACSM